MGDFLADYYAVIHYDFVVKLHEKGYLKDIEQMVKHLEKPVLENSSLENSVLEKPILEKQIVENHGFPGILNCQRDGNYLHILSTFLWLNVVHSSDHTIAYRL